IPWAMASRKAARRSRLRARKGSKAASASEQAASTSAADPPPNGGSNSAPVAGFTARNVLSVPRTERAPINISPVTFILVLLDPWYGGGALKKNFGAIKKNYGTRQGRLG